jgi:hypothetical protein
MSPKGRKFIFFFKKNQNTLFFSKEPISSYFCPAKVAKPHVLYVKHQTMHTFSGKSMQKAFA